MIAKKWTVVATIVPIMLTIASPIGFAAESTTNVEEKSIDSKQSIQEYDKKANAIHQMLEDRKQQITKLTFKVENLENQIEESVKYLDRKKEEFEEISSVYFENGEKIGLTSVLIQSEDTSDFIHRLIHFKSIAKKESAFIQKYINLQEQIKKDRQTVDNANSKIKKLKREITTLKAKLKKTQSDKENYMSELHTNEAEELLEAEYEIEEKEAANIMETQHKADEIVKEAEEERGKQEALYQLYKEMADLRRKVHKNVPGPSYPYGVNGEQLSTHPLEIAEESKGNSLFMRPATGSITSGFGKRSLGNHYGVDIGKNGRKGDVPIVAAADGVVLKSYYSSSYGNVVFIRHTFGTETYTTVYAHMEVRAVKAGSYVKKGMHIGNMGNTGRSFGPHLHFEIHKGEWQVTKSTAIDPLNFISR
ncbi:peptidoglycan DD-metalloendopeptidase family protein [Pseudobacillus sp. 179-B 2D1 NHS]|uniref:peptidoglycan DD-metalloendopeptidase family protein n=1 Tax=Pseudobacillus sp. 179-B 2D1 NHS TaxID=3374292 RepID=UPI00387A0423